MKTKIVFSLFLISIKFLISQSELINVTNVKFPGRRYQKCNSLTNNQNISVTYNDCHPPYCSCLSTAIPYYLLKENTPQFVVIIMEGAITAQAWCSITNTLGFKRRNPNGCPIGLSLIPHHIETDYCLLRKLLARGYELIFTPETPASEIEDEDEPDLIKYWKNADTVTWMEKINTAMDDLKKASGAEKIRGYRAAKDIPITEEQIQAANAFFDFDTSSEDFSFDRDPLTPYVSKNTNDKIPFYYWPYTFDNANALQCQNNRINAKFCPLTSNYKGLWEIPKYALVNVTDVNEAFQPLYYCFEFTSPFTCPLNGLPLDAESAVEALWLNLEQRYLSNRAPLIINMKASTINSHPILGDALHEFINIAQERLKGDLWFVTASQLIDWLKAGRGISIEEMNDFNPMMCNYSSPVDCQPQGFECMLGNGECPEYKPLKIAIGLGELVNLFGDGVTLAIIQCIALTLFFIYLIFKDSQ